jgi:hypothetical protein
MWNKTPHILDSNIIVTFTLYHRGKTPTPRHIWIGGWVDPRAGLGGMAKRKIPASSGTQTPIFQPVASHCTA